MEFLHGLNHFANVDPGFLVGESIVLEVKEEFASWEVLHEEAEVVSERECGVQRYNEAATSQH